jgi:hypothetical protein
MASSQIATISCCCESSPTMALIERSVVRSCRSTETALLSRVAQNSANPVSRRAASVTTLTGRTILA